MSARDQLGFWLGAYNAKVEEQNELHLRTNGRDRYSRLMQQESSVTDDIVLVVMRQE